MQVKVKVKIRKNMKVKVKNKESERDGSDCDDRASSSPHLSNYQPDRNECLSRGESFSNNLLS